jgi:hypothetical protein
MSHYRDINGDSGVSAYEAGSSFIDVRFKNGSVYRYTSTSAGAAAIETMKQLAARGDGLNAFINRQVKQRFSARLR